MIKNSFEKLSDNPRSYEFVYTPFMNESKVEYYKDLKKKAD
jgi:hypothetical protein